MTKSTITRERLEQLANFKGAPVTRQEEQELARMALAAMDSEPYGYVNQFLYEQNGVSGLSNDHEYYHDSKRHIPLYRHAQPAPERNQVRSEHAEWSQATFGNVGPVGPLKHLSKEALEAAAEPGDLSEWADMQFLLWDAQRRAGITDEQITQAMIEKLVVNKQREWPEPNDGEPRLHIKSQPAPVLPDEMPCGGAADDYHDGYQDGWNACRAAMLQAGDAVRDLSTPVDPQVAEYEQNVMQAGNSPVIPDTWIPVSERLPEEGGRYWCYVGEQNDLGKSHYQWNCSWNGERWWVESENGGIVTHWMPLPAAPQEVNHG